jgi:SNF2 family DNA or RNA helicase
MGLGKTSITLDALNNLFFDGAIRGALIIAPLRVSVLTWPHEIRKWEQFRWMKVALLRTKEGVQAWKDGSADIYLLNYERIPQFLKECVHGRRKTRMPAQVVVWDELSKAKSQSSKRINLFRHYRDRFTYHWGLTGTPRPNGHLDLFAQLRLLDDGKTLGKGFGNYRDAYFKPENPHSDHPKFILLPGAKEKIDQKISKTCLVLRSEDWVQMPTVHREEVEVSLPSGARRVYSELEKEFFTEISDGFEVEAPTIAAKMQKLLQVTSGAIYNEEKEVAHVHDAKLIALRKLSREIGEPLLVATAFKHEVSRILKFIPEAETFSHDSLDRWEKGEIRMLVAHPAQIGHGVDRLQHGGRHIVWFTPTWSFELYDQFNARLIRMGQERETVIHHLICPGSIDDAVMEALRTKEEGQSAFMAAVKNLQELKQKT